jgi:hypothetical protein
VDPICPVRIVLKQLSRVHVVVTHPCNCVAGSGFQLELRQRGRLYQRHEVSEWSSEIVGGKGVNPAESEGIHVEVSQGRWSLEVSRAGHGRMVKEIEIDIPRRETRVVFEFRRD